MRFSFDRFDFTEPGADTARPAVIDAAGTLDWQQPVSYTHLTLPTICSV